MGSKRKGVQVKKPPSKEKESYNKVNPKVNGDLENKKRRRNLGLTRAWSPLQLQKQTGKTNKKKNPNKRAKTIIVNNINVTSKKKKKEKKNPGYLQNNQDKRTGKSNNKTDLPHCLDPATSQLTLSTD